MTESVRFVPLPRRFVAAAVLSAVVTFVVGCGSSSSDTTSTGSEDSGLPSHAGEVRWTPLAIDQATSDQLAQRDRAEKARDELFGRLSTRLMEVMGAVGPEQAIAVCSEDAPKFARDVGKAESVRIGRTSFRLRNPDNAPPVWAREWVQERVEEPRFAASDDGWLGVLLPIRLKAQCQMCHGPEDQLMPTIRDALREAYPSDQATGFVEGDLRGWFWVEVPAA